MKWSWGSQTLRIIYPCIKSSFHSGMISPHHSTIIIVLPDMMASSNENIFRVTGPLCGESLVIGEIPTLRPVTRSFDVYFDLRPNKRLSKHSWGWWFESLSRPLWRKCNEKIVSHICISKQDHHCVGYCPGPMLTYEQSKLWQWT